MVLFITIRPKIGYTQVIVNPGLFSKADHIIQQKVKHGYIY
jgi:hypothetical protein